MNLRLLRPKIETEDLKKSKTKNCETLTKQTRRKPPKSLKVKLIKPRDTFSIESSIIVGLDPKWMIGLTSLEVYNSGFLVKTEKKTNSKLK